MRYFTCCFFFLTVTLSVFCQEGRAETPSQAPIFRPLYSFTGNYYDAGYPTGGVILDAQGNLYGTNEGTGFGPEGVVFELSPPTSGATWTFSTLFSFGYPNGYYAVSNLVFDSKGNLYGTTDFGGQYENGTVFEVSPDGNGGWQGTTIYNFQGAPDGSNPIAGLVVDSLGNLYGTTMSGGAGKYCCGTVFELSPSGAGWVETVLYSFPSTGGIGTPQAGLAFDSHGNLYGTASFGGVGTGGGVFEMSPMPSGGWTYKEIYVFSGKDGLYPYSTPAFDSTGNLYGTTAQGGVHNDGTVFELSPSAGTWSEKILHNFNGTDGDSPYCGVILSTDGNVYGATNGGPENSGVVYELSSFAGNWKFNPLHTFNGEDGSYPTQLSINADDRLFGTTYGGGRYKFGTVYTITP
jgi:uncharacterized repeat protein (TIGR03803 family)